jgi:hypothetical protein
MGMFDSVMFNCPKCNKVIEVQSKSGACTLACYEPDEVPAAIAGDIYGELVSCECGEEWKVSSSDIHKTVRMMLR